MARGVSQVEKDLMWTLYQKHGTYKKVGEIMGRHPDTVSRHIRERAAAVNAVRVVINAKNT